MFFAGQEGNRKEPRTQDGHKPSGTLSIRGASDHVSLSAGTAKDGQNQELRRQASHESKNSNTGST